MKNILITLLIPFLLYGEKVEVTSKNFYAKDSEKQAHFIDDVLVKQEKSWIHSDELIVYFDDNNETIQYDAIGKATFEIFRDESHYKGKAHKVTFYPKTSEYLFAGNAIINDIIKDRHIKGNIIEINTITGEASVKGDNKKPIKFTFDTEKK
ncbi:MAG: LptA/OstA family protein [Campylobacterota bacterium]|nr:LptA/OstA family protein [Campylobacterota bacterium]